VTTSYLAVLQVNWNKFLLNLEDSLPVDAELSSDSSSVINVLLTNSDDEATVTLADYFRHLSSCQFLVVMLLRHFA